MLRKQVYQSPIGDLSLVADDQALLGCWLEGQKHFERGVADYVMETSPILEATKSWLADYFAGKRPDPTSLPLAPVGTAFNQRLRAELLKIPYGETSNYKILAEQLGQKAALAVGNSISKNPFLIIVPCHRVLSIDGDWNGYVAGVPNKIWLLAHERLG